MHDPLPLGPRDTPGVRPHDCPSPPPPRRFAAMAVVACLLFIVAERSGAGAVTVLDGVRLRRGGHLDAGDGFSSGSNSRIGLHFPSSGMTYRDDQAGRAPRLGQDIYISRPQGYSSSSARSDRLLLGVPTIRFSPPGPYSGVRQQPRIQLMPRRVMAEPRVISTTRLLRYVSPSARMRSAGVTIKGGRDASVRALNSPRRVYRQQARPRPAPRVVMPDRQTGRDVFILGSGQARAGFDRPARPEVSLGDRVLVDTHTGRRVMLAQNFRRGGAVSAAANSGVGSVGRQQQQQQQQQRQRRVLMVQRESLPLAIQDVLPSRREVLTRTRAASVELPQRRHSLDVLAAREPTKLSLNDMDPARGRILEATGGAAGRTRLAMDPNLISAARQPAVILGPKVTDTLGEATVILDSTAQPVTIVNAKPPTLGVQPVAIEDSRVAVATGPSAGKGQPVAIVDPKPPVPPEQPVVVVEPKAPAAAEQPAVIVDVIAPAYPPEVIAAPSVQDTAVIAPPPPPAVPGTPVHTPVQPAAVVDSKVLVTDGQATIVADPNAYSTAGGQGAVVVDSSAPITAGQVPVVHPTVSGATGGQMTVVHPKVQSSAGQAAVVVAPTVPSSAGQSQPSGWNVAKGTAPANAGTSTADTNPPQTREEATVVASGYIPQPHAPANAGTSTADTNPPQTREEATVVASGYIPQPHAPANAGTSTADTNPPQTREEATVVASGYIPQPHVTCGIMLPSACLVRDEEMLNLLHGTKVVRQCLPTVRAMCELMSS